MYTVNSANPAMLGPKFSKQATQLIPNNTGELINK